MLCALSRHFKVLRNDCLLPYGFVVLQRMLGCCTWLKSSSNPSDHVIDLSYLIVCVDVHTQLPETNTETKVSTQEKMAEQFYMLSIHLIPFLHAQPCLEHLSVCLSISPSACLSVYQMTYWLLKSSVNPGPIL